MDNTSGNNSNSDFDKNFLLGVENQIAADNAAQRQRDERKRGLIIGVVIGFVVLAAIVAVLILMMSGGGGEA